MKAIHTVLLCSLAAAAPAAAADVRVTMTAPEEVEVGATFPLEVTVENTGDEMVIVREPMHDYRSFDFEVQLDDGRRSLYTKYHPRAGQPSTLKGQDLEEGGTLKFLQVVDAIAAGAWTFQPLYHGAGGTVKGEARTVTVTPKGGASRALVEMKTGKGVIRAAFWPEVAPATSLHIAELVRTGFYDDLIFHRTIQGFMIQGGCPRGDGTGGPGYSIEAEFNERPHVAGVFSMARNGDPYEYSRPDTWTPPRPKFANSAGSQFFLCDATAGSLDGKYTAFGQVVEGIDVVHAIAAAPAVVGNEPTPSKPVDPVVIEEALLVVPAAAPADGETDG